MDSQVLFASVGLTLGLYRTAAQAPHTGEMPAARGRPTPEGASRHQGTSGNTHRGCRQASWAWPHKGDSNVVLALGGLRP